MVFTDDSYKEMIKRCKTIASDFINKISEQRSVLDEKSEDDLFKFDVDDDIILGLFEQLKTEMHLKSKLIFFRDNDKERAYYDNSNDCVALPMFINSFPAQKIVEYMAHELFHAFQYSAICEPVKYKCFDDKTIKTWKYEFKNYVNGETDNDLYHDQDVEKTARYFGKLISK